jgi:hypothetical protein
VSRRFGAVFGLQIANQWVWAACNTKVQNALAGTAKSTSYRDLLCYTAKVELRVRDFGVNSGLGSL